MLKCDFNKVAEMALQHGYSPVKVLHIFTKLFPKNTSRWLLLNTKPKSEVGVPRCFSKKVFLKVSQNSLVKTLCRSHFLTKFQA